jgi:HEAT repeat protein
MNLSLLPAALHGNDPYLSADAGRLIGTWRLNAAIPDLLRHVQTSPLYSKVAAIESLAKLAPPEARDCLAPVFENPGVPDDFYWVQYKGVRAAAAIALLQLGDTAGVEWLKDRLTHKDASVFRWYAPALLRVSNPLPPALANLLTLEALCNPAHRDAMDLPPYSDPGNVCMLCEALALVEDPAADEDLRFYMNFFSRFVRGQAYRSLYHRHPTPVTLREIHAAALHHGTTFDLAVCAILEGDIPALTQFTRSAETPFDRATAVDGLATLTPSPESDAALLAALEDPDAYVRQCAVEALGTRPPDLFQKPLERLRNQEHEPRVLCACEAVTHTPRN